MQRTILLLGTDDLLAASISALMLKLTEHVSIRRVRPRCPGGMQSFTESVTESLCQVAPERARELFQKDINSRLHILEEPQRFDFVLDDCDPIEAVWYLCSAQRDLKSRHLDSLARVLAALNLLGACEFNLVMPACPEASHEGENCRGLREATIQHCRDQKIGYRIFRTSGVLGAGRTLFGSHGLRNFLNRLYDLKREIQERLPEYFDFEPLRYLGPAAAELNLIRANDAADLMVRIAQNKDTLNCQYDIVSPDNVSFGDLCKRIGSAYGLNILPAEDEQELNAIDRVLEEGLGVFRTHLESPQDFSFKAAYEASGLDPEKVRLDEDAMIELFEAIFQRQEAARAARDQRIAALPQELGKTTINNHGFELTYFTGGTDGTPVIILNALGQDILYWLRLIDVLMQTHRVVIWEPRGTACTPLSFGLKEQVDDIEAILRQEAISSCHLIGWCTGPKVAVEFYLRHPQLVESMVFLNSQFKVSGTPRELITAYERNIEPLFHVLESNPTMASSVMKSLQTNLGGRKLNLFEQRDSQKLAREVLSAVNQDLKAHMLGPYQSESSTLNYAKQIIDFWSCDTLSKAGQVPVPILLVAAEYDQIAAPAMSHMARQHFPRASHVQVQGATHYLLYDRPDFLAGLIEDFFES